MAGSAPVAPTSQSRVGHVRIPGRLARSRSRAAHFMRVCSTDVRACDTRLLVEAVA
jgi:hypothetical protein